MLGRHETSSRERSFLSIRDIFTAAMLSCHETSLRERSFNDTKIYLQRLYIEDFSLIVTEFNLFTLTCLERADTTPVY